MAGRADHGQEEMTQGGVAADPGLLSRHMTVQSGRRKGTGVQMNTMQNSRYFGRSGPQLRARPEPEEQETAMSQGSLRHNSR
jgi:hypothetical protein